VRCQKGDDNLVAVGWNRKSRENRSHFVSFLTAKDEDEDEDENATGSSDAGSPVPTVSKSTRARAVKTPGSATLYLTHPMTDTPAERSPESDPKQEAVAGPDPAFERWRRKAAWVVGYGLSPEDETKRAEMKRLEQVENEWSKCQKWKNDLMRNSPSISRSSLSHMQRVFCKFYFSEFLFLGFFYRSRCGVYDQATGFRF